MEDSISQTLSDLEQRCREVRIAVGPAITASSKYWDGADGRTGVTVIGPWLDSVTKRYWCERERVSSGTYDHFSKLLEKAQRQISNAEAQLEYLPQSLLTQSDKRAVQSRGRASSIPLPELFVELQRRIATLENLVSGGSERKGRNPVITETCLELMSAWEEHNGRPFHGTLDTTRIKVVDKSGRPKFEFLHPDALFVQLAIQAIDPDITDAQVRTGLRLAVKLSSSTYSVLQNRMNLVL